MATSENTRRDNNTAAGPLTPRGARLRAAWPRLKTPGETLTQPAFESNTTLFFNALSMYFEFTEKTAGTGITD